MTNFVDSNQFNLHTEVMIWLKLKKPLENFLRFCFSYRTHLWVLEGNVRYSTWLVICVLSLLTIIRPTIFIYTKIIPVGKNLGYNLKNFIQQSVPNNAIVTIKNGVASTNLAEPYFISVDKSIFEQLLSGEVNPESWGISKIRILTVDTNASAEDFELYQSLALLTKSSLVYYNDNKISISPLRNIRDLTISRSEIIDKIDLFNQNKLINTCLYFLTIITPFILFLACFIRLCLWICLINLLLFILAKIVNINSNYLTLWSYTVYVSFLPLLFWIMIKGIFQFSYSLILMYIISISYFIFKKYLSLHL
jgi:hypothetical protein